MPSRPTVTGSGEDLTSPFLLINRVSKCNRDLREAKGLGGSKRNAARSRTRRTLLLFQIQHDMFVMAAGLPWRLPQLCCIVTVKLRNGTKHKRIVIVKVQPSDPHVAYLLGTAYRLCFLLWVFKRSTAEFPEPDGITVFISIAAEYHSDNRIQPRYNAVWSVLVRFDLHCYDYVTQKLL